MRTAILFLLIIMGAEVEQFYFHAKLSGTERLQPIHVYLLIGIVMAFIQDLKEIFKK